MMISKENKLFEEIDKSLASKTVSKDEKKGIIERQSSWSGQIKGIRSFPSGTTEGKGISKIFANGISISDWHGIFNTEKKYEISFIGKDISKDGKFYVIRTFFTNVVELDWINGLVCILDGKHDIEKNSFVCIGYKLM